MRLAVSLLIVLGLCMGGARADETTPVKRPTVKTKRARARKAPPKPAPTGEKTDIPSEQTAAEKASAEKAAPKVDASDVKPPPSTPVDPDPTPSPSIPRFDPSWRECREDKDCIAIDTHCGWGCINGSSEQPASMYYRQLAPYIECSATSEVKPNAICVKKECVCQR